jgi:ATP-dependent DNA helicase RecG
VGEKLDGSEKSSEIGSEKICRTMKDNPRISARELSVMLGISSRAVEKRLAQLKEAGVIKRVGSAKGGHWEVVDT